MQSTLSLFRQLYEQLPPLFPLDQKDAIGQMLSHLESDTAITLEEVEDAMITAGYTVWPWNRAYQEFYDSYETDVGEHFLMPLLAPHTQERFKEFKRYGGSLGDILTGNGARFFNTDQRRELGTALVEMSEELRRYTARQVMGTEKDRYVRRVREFEAVVNDIRETVARLRELADREADHTNLAREIRDRARAFEYGLCFLGPEVDYGAVRQSEEHFAGRRHELNRLKGINVPLEIDWWEEKDKN